MSQDLTEYNLMEELDEATKVWMEHHGKEMQWVYGVVQEGFVIHYLDGDYRNLEPTNLALVWGGDVRELERLVPEGEVEVRRLSMGQACYEGRVRGERWSEVGRAYGVDAHTALTNARAWARTRNKPWPVPRA